MADTINYGLKGVGPDVQLGKKNPRIKVSGSLVQFRNAEDDAYVNVEVLDPTLDQHAATKGYVDAVASGLDLKDSVRAATQADSGFTQAGSGVGATLTSATTAISENDIDGVTLVVGDRVLVKAESSGSDNGIYEMTQAADGASADAVLTRATDADEDSEVTSGMFTFVEEGTSAGQGWVLTTVNPIVVDTTVLSFTQFSEKSIQDPLYRQQTFGYGDVGTNAFTVALPTTAIVQRVKVDIETEWDAESTIIVKDAGGEIYMSADENDPEVSIVYVADRLGQNQIGADALQAVLADIGSPSAGSAVIHVDYALA